MALTMSGEIQLSVRRKTVWEKLVFLAVRSSTKSRISNFKPSP
jgi:hypothetical protein